MFLRVQQLHLCDHRDHMSGSPLHTLPVGDNIIVVHNDKNDHNGGSIVFMNHAKKEVLIILFQEICIASQTF